MRYPTLVLFAGAALTLFAGGAPANAQQPKLCGEHAAIVAGLERRFGEQRIGFGLDSRGRLIELLAAENGTWSVLLTSPGGRTCLVSSGVKWHRLSPPEAGSAVLWRR